MSVKITYINHRTPFAKYLAEDLLENVLKPVAFNGLIGIVEIHGDLYETPGFAPSQSRAARKQDALVVLCDEVFFRENATPHSKIYHTEDLSKTEYGALPTILRLFTAGVENQLGQTVSYLGWRHGMTNEIVWIYVPAERENRFPGPRD